MDRRTAEELDEVLEAPMGFYLRAGKLVRLLTADNVAEVMDRLPAPFREEFLPFAREVYLPRGPRVAVAGPPLSESSLEALRGWMFANDARRHEPARHPKWDGELGVDHYLVNIVAASGSRGREGRRDACPLVLRPELLESPP
jgi:hypothetical protein